jgi:hypothetical protein
VVNSRRYDDLSDDQLRDVDAASERFEQSLRNETPVSIESHLEATPAAIRDAVFCELLAIELEWRFAHDQVPDISEFHARFPAHYDRIRQVFCETGLSAPPAMGAAVSIEGNTEASGEHRRSEQLQKIGRYKLEELVGKGSFGLVYRAHDEQLDRMVAIKVPHDTVVSRPENRAKYLAEAQTVARLDHPHIVPVYDFGGSDEVPCYIVSKYVDGSSLSARLKEHPAQRLEWIHAVLFCNWLSRKEGRKPCYERYKDKEPWDFRSDGPRKKWGLIPRADGYRLPTEAEWEYACRAGTLNQDYSFGNDEQAANRYAVYGTTRTKICGSKHMSS